MRADQPETVKRRRWIERPHLFQNDKQLQFFDTMSLYFHLRHAGARGTAEYGFVPLNPTADATVALREIDERVYGLAPFRFAGDRLTLTCDGRYAVPFPPDFPPAEVGAALRRLPAARQTYELVAT